MTNPAKLNQLPIQFLLSMLSFLTFLSGCASLDPHIQKFGNIEFARVDDQPLRLDIYEPKQFTGSLPAMLWIHGGAWIHGSKDECPIAFMATQNLAIVSIDYRLAPKAIFPAQLYDCKGAIRWLRANADKFHIDPNHIGVFGASAGGHLALLLATTGGNTSLEGDVGGNPGFSSKVECVCAFYPPTDLDRLATDPKDRRDPKSDIAKLIGGPLSDNVAKAKAASPLTYVNSNCPPIFLMHGDKDRIVPLDQSKIFLRRLQECGVQSELSVIPGKGHGIIAPPPVADQIYQFFAKWLHS